MTKEALLLVNLGSPDSYRLPDVRKYLRELLMDERVMDYPYWFRYLLIEGIILRTRPRKSAKSYKSIWWEEGSPLIVLSKRLTRKVQKYSDMPIGLGMRYGNPSIECGIQQLVDANPHLKEVLLIPLYPHYSMSSYETAVVKTREIVSSMFRNLKLKIKKAFFDDKRYLKAVAKALKPILNRGYDHLLFSYHGIPERHIRKSDITHNHCLRVENCCQVDSPAHEFCYRHQTFKTTELIANCLQLPKYRYSTSFQSRLGYDSWLMPFTDKTIVEMAQRGVKKLVVVCPAFVTDCLETIEEIGEEGQNLFLRNQGKELILVPCLNDQDHWAKLLAEWAREDLQL